MRYPRYYRFFDRMIYRYKFRKACRNADRIIAVSHCTKKDIIDYWGIPSDKIDVGDCGLASGALGDRDPLRDARVPPDEAQFPTDQPTQRR